MSDKVKQLDQLSFQSDVVDARRPVLVDFYADWCAPCRMIAPVVEQLADEYEGRLDVRKINVDASPELASQFAVRSIPTLIVFDKGLPVETVVGAANKATLSEIAGRFAA